jgi:hypothetical protein
VDRLDRPEDGAQLRPGEILVTAQTSVGWTLLKTGDRVDGGRAMVESLGCVKV